MRHLTSIVLALILSLALSRTIARGEDAPAAPPSSKPATSAPAAGADHVVEATDQENLKAAAGETITVHGKVSGIFKANSGRVLINFEGANRDFVGMITKENAEAVTAGFNGDLDAALTGKTILLTGEIKLFREKPQIEISKPDQIKVEEEKK